MTKLVIDNQEIEVEEGTSILQACEQLGIKIPRFCYHDKLSVAGNCRMCLVEVENMAKPVASCVQPCSEGMVVHTNTSNVKNARDSVMELLLINHPLDCPVCDQGGECDLQDYAYEYRNKGSRYNFAKRQMPNKDLGPLIKTDMNRCIACTRCIRFMDEICGVPSLGGLYRGEKLDIGTYVSKVLTSELSGNLIDVCPVGALTNKPAAGTYRPWELRKTISVDVFDAVGSNICIDTRDNEIIRVTPIRNDGVNEEWISDKARFAIDGLKKNRIDAPYVDKVQADWSEAFNQISEKLGKTSPERIAVIAGNMVDCESMFAMKMLMSAMKCCNLDCCQDGSVYDISARNNYIFNAGIAGIDEADAIILIGTNPRKEAPVLNARIRKRLLKGDCSIALIGEEADLGYPYTHLGNTPQAITSLMGVEGDFAYILSRVDKPMFILGAGVMARDDGAAVHQNAKILAHRYGAVRTDWNGFNVLQNVSSRVGGLDIGFVPPEGTGYGVHGVYEGKADVLWLVGADELDFDRIRKANPNVFIIYQGHIGSAGAENADVVMPAAAYTEKDAIYVNTEGRPQTAFQAVFPPGMAKPDWSIIREFSELYGCKLPFDSLAELRALMFSQVPVFIIEEHTHQEIMTSYSSYLNDSTMSNAPFKPAIDNFYMTDTISRNSDTMKKCTEQILGLSSKTYSEGA